jgi:hypothetical protein
MDEVKEWAEEIKFQIIFREDQSEEPMILDFLEEEGLHTSVYNKKCTSLNQKKKITRKTIKKIVKKMSRESCINKVKRKILTRVWVNIENRSNKMIKI